jgi:hypothetical protein
MHPLQGEGDAAAVALGFYKWLGGCKILNPMITLQGERCAAALAYRILQDCRLCIAELRLPVTLFGRQAGTRCRGALHRLRNPASSAAPGQSMLSI